MRLKTTLLLFVFAILFSSCSENDGPSQEICSSWELVGFGNYHYYNEIPEGTEAYYTIAFHDNNTFSGTTSYHQYRGEYNLNKRIITIFNVECNSTMEDESIVDEYNYIECMGQINSYTVDGHTLVLHYGQDKFGYYMKFKKK
ncbi:MAG: hypothetical protein E6767_02380 [Dysgonomonas sp.]|nr:hypothetical protein [Dysgonomonas sp.]